MLTKKRRKRKNTLRRWESALDPIVLSKVMIPGILIERGAWVGPLYGRVNNAFLLITLGTYRIPQ